ncbi:MAG: hypothetical protein SGI74_10940 [Oligoflexia bacterium]|nr:hypothetical protein [Oligoflexia bacterium]
MKKVVLLALTVAAFGLAGCQKEESKGQAPTVAVTPQATNCPPGMPVEYCNSYTNNGQYNQYGPQYGNDAYGIARAQYYNCLQSGGYPMNVSQWGQSPQFACVPQNYYPQNNYGGYRISRRWGFSFGVNYQSFGGSGYGSYCNTSNATAYCGQSSRCMPEPRFGTQGGICCSGYSGYGT